MLPTEKCWEENKIEKKVDQSFSQGLTEEDSVWWDKCFVNE